MTALCPASAQVPFFILGCGRSGTSLLGRMLDSHPRLTVPPESHLLNLFVPWLPHYGDLGRRQNQTRLVDDILSTFHIRHWSPQLQRQAVLERLSAADRDGFGAVFEAVLGAWADTQGKPRWGEKTPQHTLYWRAIREWFPQSQIIHMMRDGRDVALSFIAAKFGPKTAYGAARRWARELQQIEALKAELDPAQFCEVRYEDLLAAPEAELSKICAVLGEEYSAQMLAFQQRGNSDYLESTNRRNLKGPLLRSNAEKWKKSMPARQVRYFEAVARPTLLRGGYASAFAVQPELSAREVLWQRTVASLPKRLMAMLKNRDGHRFEWARWRLLLRLRVTDPIV